MKIACHLQYFFGYWLAHLDTIGVVFMRSMFRSSILAVAVFVASELSAVPILSMDASAGRRWNEIDDNGAQSNEFNVSALMKIADLPVAAGVGASIVDYNETDFETGMGLNSVDTSWGYDVALEFKAWLPKDVLNVSVTPHIKYSYDLFSDYTIKGENDRVTVNADLTTSGYKVNLGGTYKLDDKISFLGEYSIGSQKMKSKYRVAAKNSVQKFRSTDKFSLDSKALLFGVSVLM